jgi:hypothetical protein
MNAVEISSIIASFVSLILAILAIGLSIYFFVQSKDTETKVQTALEGIRSQTDTLQGLSAKWMDRLTKYVTTPRTEVSESSQILLTIIRELPENIVSRLGKAPSQTNEQGLRQEVITAYIALYYYTGASNVWAQFCLPAPENVDSDPSYYSLVKGVVDRSYTDFIYIAKVLEGVPSQELQQSRLQHLLDECKNTYRDRIMETSHYYAKMAEAKKTG